MRKKETKERYKQIAKNTMLQGAAAANRLQISADNAADSYARSMRNAVEAHPAKRRSRRQGHDRSALRQKRPSPQLRASPRKPVPYEPLGYDRASRSVCSAFERGDHYFDQGAATEIGHTDRCSRRQVVAEEFGPSRVHLLLLGQIRHEDRGADNAGCIRSRLFQILGDLAEDVAGLLAHRDAGVVGDGAADEHESIGFDRAVHDRRTDVADDVHDVLILILECSRMEAADAEIADPRLGAAIDDQLRHHGAGAGAELEAM